MRSLLALMILNGLSFIAWGCTGLCRFLHERTLQRRNPFQSAAIVAFLACVFSALLIAVSHRPVILIASEIAAIGGFGAKAHGDLVSWVTYAWMSVCGATVLYAALRLFKVTSLNLAFTLFAPLYWFTTTTLSGSAAKHAARFWLPHYHIMALTAGAICAGAAAVLLAHWTNHKNKPDSFPLEDEDSAEQTRRLTPCDVAVVVCAHNEEHVIRNCLDRITKLVPISNIFVGSDGSTDKTVQVVEEYGCNILDIQPNGGKAQALDSVLRHFNIYEQFQLALILDADSEVDEKYLDAALPLFDDQQIVAIAGHARPKWYSHWLPRWAMFFSAYRVRMYWLTQAFLRYGQTWKHSNVSFIIPGFASMYRCTALEEIDIAAPGLSVEDFNMTFEVHRKGLGEITYTPRVRCTSQEAHGLTDYSKQVQRWYLGFWQTVRRHGLWPSLFWLSLGVFVVEMILQSVALMAIPFVVSWYVFEGGAPVSLWVPVVGTVVFSIADVLIGVLIADYALTTLVAVMERKAVLMFYGLGFAGLRCIDAFLFLYTLLLAFVVKSDGRWASPKRLLATSNLSENRRET